MIENKFLAGLLFIYFLWPYITFAGIWLPFHKIQFLNNQALISSLGLIISFLSIFLIIKFITKRKVPKKMKIIFIILAFSLLLPGFLFVSYLYIDCIILGHPNMLNGL